MTAFQRILINTERWNETVVTPSLAKPHELIFVPLIYDIFFNFHHLFKINGRKTKNFELKFVINNNA